MAKNNKKEDNPFLYIPANTIIEVIAIDGDKVYKKKMQYSEALKIEKKVGWIYKNYELNRSAYPDAIDLDKKL